MSDKLFFNDLEMDLGEDTRIGLTLQVNNIAEVANRNSNMTNQFKLEKTQVNLNNIGHANQASSISDKPYRKLKARYISEGIEIIQNGYAMIEQVDKAINSIVYSGNGSFFDLLQELKLSDIDLSEFDHIWNKFSIIDSLPNNEGYTYALVEYGKTMSSTALTVFCKGLLPSVFVKTLFEKIFAAQDYNFNGTFIDGDEFKLLMVPCVADELKHSQAWIDEKKFLAHNTVIQTMPAWAGVDQLIKVKFQDDFTFPNFDAGNHYDAVLTNEYQCPENMIANFKWHLIVKYNRPPGSGSTTVDFLDGLHAVLYSLSIASGDTVEIDLETTLRGFALNEFVLLYFNLNSAVGQDIEILAGSYFTVELENSPITFDSMLELAGLLPDMKQIDFLKAIMNQYCVIPSTDDVSRTVSFNYFKDISSNIPIKKNWSEKFYEAKEDSDGKLHKIKYNIGSYGQKNNLKYAEDEGVTKYFGDGYFLIDDETLEDEVDLFTLPFAATESVLRMGTSVLGANVCNIKKIDLAIAGYTYSLKVKPRILLMERTYLPGLSVAFDDDVTTPTNYNQPLPFGRFKMKTVNALVNPTPSTFALCFDDTLIVDNYVELMGMLFRTKFVTAYFDLKAKDIENFNHMIPVYVEYFGETFYVNKILNWKSNELTQVELIRL